MSNVNLFSLLFAVLYQAKFMFHPRNIIKAVLYLKQPAAMQDYHQLKARLSYLLITKTQYVDVDFNANNCLN